MSNQEHTMTNIKKPFDRKVYMRNYMKRYNEKKYGIKQKLTDDEKRERRKISHRKYYLKKRDSILLNQKKKVIINRINKLKNKLSSLENNII